jgi:hypothetical protein
MDNVQTKYHNNTPLSQNGYSSPTMCNANPLLLNKCPFSVLLTKFSVQLFMIKDINMFLLKNKTELHYTEHIYQGVLCKTHKAYVPIAQTSSPTNHALLTLCLGNISYDPTIKCSLVHGLAFWAEVRILLLLTVVNMLEDYYCCYNILLGKKLLLSTDSVYIKFVR